MCVYFILGTWNWVTLVLAHGRADDGVRKQRSKQRKCFMLGS